MSSDYTGNVVVVTGAAGALGRAVVEHFAASGATARIMLNAPVKFTSNTSNHSSSVIFHNGAERCMPAAFTR